MENIFKTEKLNVQICSTQLLKAVENLEHRMLNIGEGDN